MHRIMIGFGSLPAMTVALREQTTTLGSSPSDDMVLPPPEIGPRHLTLQRTWSVLHLRADEGDEVQVNGRLARQPDQKQQPGRRPRVDRR